MFDMEEIQRLHGTLGDPVLSLYLRYDTDPASSRSLRARLVGLVREMRSHLPPGETAEADALGRDVARILAQFEEPSSAIGGGIVIFASESARLFEQIRLPFVPFEAALAGPRPYVRSLCAIATRYEPTCVLVADRRSATIEIHVGDDTVLREVRDDESLRDRNFGGWYGLEEYGAHRRSDELSRRHLEATADMVRELTPKFDRLVVASHRPLVREIVHALAPESVAKLAGTFVVDPRTATDAELRALADREVERTRASEEEEFVALVRGAAAVGIGAATGVAGVLEAANARAISEVALDATRPVRGFVCEGCGALSSRASESCAICGARVRGSDDVFEELLWAVRDAGGEVRHMWDPRARALARLRFEAKTAALTR